jgi:hypothetical protein
MSIYLGPWQWVSDENGERWQSPENTVGTLDVRSLPECGVAGGSPGLGIFEIDDARRNVSSDYDLIATHWNDKSSVKSTKVLKRIHASVAGDDVVKGEMGVIRGSGVF